MIMDFIVVTVKIRDDIMDPSNYMKLELMVKEKDELAVYKFVEDRENQMFIAGWICGYVVALSALGIMYLIILIIKVMVK